MMTCTTCGSPDDVMEREGSTLCRSCRERFDWARIIDIVQSGIRLEPDIDFDHAAPAELGADPFA